MQGNVSKNIMRHYHLVRQYVLKRNAFDTESVDEHTRQNEILSTRLYTVFLIILLYGFALYALLANQLTIITVSKPSIKQYRDLVEQYSSTLQCPCERISVAYEEIINVVPVYHQICSSDFVSQRWIDYLFYENSSYYFQLDFRHSGSGQFQILRMLCQQAQQTIENSLTQFYSMQLITNELVSSQTFDIQTNSFIQLFQRTTPSAFLDVLNLIRLILIRYILLSGMGTARSVKCCVSTIDSVYPDVIRYYETQSKYFSCICLDVLVCKLPGGIYTNIDRYDHAGSSEVRTLANSNTWRINATFLLPGMFIGCSPIESLFYSSSECLFKETCLNQIGSYINYTSMSINSFAKLNESLSLTALTYETLINNLFIDTWIIHRSFDNYFDQCRPIYCQYTNEIRETWTSILVSIIGLYSGLSVILSLLIPTIVNFVRKKREPQVDAEASLPKVSIKARFNQLKRQITNVIINTNIFDSYSTDEHIKRNGIISTRIYFLLILILLSIFGLYTSREMQTQLITINNPTQNQFEQLENKSLNDFHCPCNDISVKHDTFIIFQPTYHQICSSIFVSDLWIDNTYWKDTKFYSFDNFQHASSSFFELLAILCQATSETITSSLIIFDATDYLTSQVVSYDVFSSEVTSAIQLFQTTTQQLFQLRLNLIRRMISGNQFISGQSSNVMFSRFNTTSTVEYHGTIRAFNGCSCATDLMCKKVMSLYSSTGQHDLLGMYQGCHRVDSFLLSTTECFFTENCINLIKSFMYSSREVYQRLQVLDKSLATRYSSNTILERIVQNLFVEDWNAVYSYERYYNQCQPSYCSYTREQKPSFMYVLTKLIGIYGGLTIILKMFAPTIVKIVRRKKTQTTGMSFSDQISQLSQLFKSKLVSLNLFQNRLTNAQIIQKQRYATKLYLIILIITFPILVLYTSLNIKSITVTVELHRLSEYQNLQMKYPTTINCPCADISVNYNQFIEINPYYHQICSSDFISQKWIEYLYDEDRSHDQNFRATASAQFQILSSLCSQAHETVNISLAQFYATTLTSAQLISSELFQIQVDSIVSSFKKSIPLTLRQSLDMLNGIIQGNALISVYETNWKFKVLHTDPFAPIYTNPQMYGNSCSCATSSKCSLSVILNDQLNSTLKGLLVGCYPLESILQSSLECFYDQQCLNLMFSYFGQQELNDNLTILNSSLLSADSLEMNETVEHMINRLFVNHWHINYSHQNYFQQCHPSFCVYSYVQNSDLLHILTTSVSLYGSLNIVLRILSPLIIRIVLWIIDRKRTPVVPFSPPTN